MLKITDVKELLDKRVLVLCDLDVPIEDGKILDSTRLEKVLPTIKYTIDRGAKPIIAGKVGRPNGEFKEELSTRHLEVFFNSHLGEGVYEILENLRFDSREKENNAEFARELVQKTSADLFVNECFSTAHNEHASTVQIPQLLPTYLGENFAKEIDALLKVLDGPDEPVVSIIGGAKIETKKPVITALQKISQKVLIGGKIGLQWEDEIPENVVLPTDYADDQKDIGPDTISKYKEILKSSKTVIWAGPMGLYEEPKYNKGTMAIARAILDAQTSYVVIGGGNTIDALNKMSILDKFEEKGHVSTGGGAMLQFLAKKGNLPAILAIAQSQQKNG